MALDLEEYLRTAFRDKLRLQHDELHETHGRTVPAWDATTLPPSTRLLLKRREVAEAERVLQSRRERLAVPQEFRQRMEHLVQRWQQLGQREEQLRDVTLKFNTFLKASSARQERALQRAAKERARAAGQGAKAAHLHQELEGLLQRRERLAQRLQRLRGFGDYLQGVLARMGQDVPAMLAHFGALAGARAALAQQAEAGQERLAQDWARLRRYQEETGSELLRTTDELAQLRAQLEAARHDVLQGESRWAHVQGTAAQKTLLLGQVKLAVLNLFQLATTRLEVPTDVALEDTEAQLDVAPISTGTALHAGPGCHLCRPAPQGAEAASPTLACSHQHTPDACQGASEPGIAPRDDHPLLGLGRGCRGQCGAPGPTLGTEVAP
ncbi:cilia- and flagella-associated protein 73 isoform X2 [Grus americana]|uniref:cilia- and flagella-associated protein 73 isoform X2 n=1 Tax=Grus americana TaxID=9117 RepID=UPI0024079A7D|nr:cilia- and flagella-associated protein 73 isoform X2 [Grus americana]